MNDVQVSVRGEDVVKRMRLGTFLALYSQDGRATLGHVTRQEIRPAVCS